MFENPEDELDYTGYEEPAKPKIASNGQPRKINIRPKKPKKPTPIFVDLTEEEEKGEGCSGRCPDSSFCRDCFQPVGCTKEEFAQRVFQNLKELEQIRDQSLVLKKK